jgi:hypothetical protein
VSRSSTDWIGQCIAAALAEHPVPEAVTTLLRAELQGAMSERSMRPNEETTLAAKLLENMTTLETRGPGVCG